MKQLTREDVIRLLMSDEVYNSLDLEKFYSQENEAYPSVYEVLDKLGIGGDEIQAAMEKA